MGEGEEIVSGYNVRLQNMCIATHVDVVQRNSYPS
jgi:hypothetical protein